MFRLLAKHMAQLVARILDCGDSGTDNRNLVQQNGLPN